MPLGNPPTLAGFCRVSMLSTSQPSAQHEPARPGRRGAEKTTHLARRRGGGMTARARGSSTPLPLCSTPLPRAMWHVNSPDRSFGIPPRATHSVRYWRYHLRPHYHESLSFTGRKSIARGSINRRPSWQPWSLTWPTNRKPHAPPAVLTMRHHQKELFLCNCTK